MTLLITLSPSVSLLLFVADIRIRQNGSSHSNEQPPNMALNHPSHTPGCYTDIRWFYWLSDSLTDRLYSVIKQPNRDWLRQVASVCYIQSVQTICYIFSSHSTFLFLPANVRITRWPCCPATSHRGPPLADKWQPRGFLVPPAAFKPLGSC